MICKICVGWMSCRGSDGRAVDSNPEVCSSNLDTSKFYIEYFLLSTVLKRQNKKEASKWPFKKYFIYENVWKIAKTEKIILEWSETSHFQSNYTEQISFAA